MSETNINKTENKRKRKKSFLKNARKYGKKGCYGRGSQLESDKYHYFVKILEVYREGFESEEDKKAFVNNVFQQTENEEVQIACNQIGCRVIEMLLPFADDGVLMKFTGAFSEDLRPLCSDRFATHVLEELVSESHKRSLKNEDDEKKIYFKNFLLKISKFLLNNLEDFIWDIYAIHVIRTCIQNLANIPKEEKNGGKTAEVKSEEISISEYYDIVMEYGERLLTWPQFPDLCKNDHVSALLQILLRALQKVSPKLLKKYLTKLLDESFSQGIDENSKSEILPPVFLSTSSLMLVETYLQVATTKKYTQILAKCFQGRLVKLSKIRNTNFSVQKLITYCQEKTEFELIFDELSEHFPDIMKAGHSGVIWALGEGCKRLSAKQAPFVNNIIKSLNCEAEDRQKFLIICLAKMKNHDEIKFDEDLQNAKLDLHGTLIVQLLLEFNKPIKIVNILLEMDTNHLLKFFSNTKGCHIADSFMKSKFIGEKSREKLVRKMRGAYQDLATTKYGSRAFDAIWNAAGFKHKMMIMDELSHKDNIWSNSNFGKIISSKVNLSLYKRNKEEWKHSFNNDNKVQELLDALNQ